MRTAKLVEFDEETLLIDAKHRFHRRNRPALDQLWNRVLPIFSRRNLSVLRETHAAAFIQQHMTVMMSRSKRSVATMVTEMTSTTP